LTITKEDEKNGSVLILIQDEMMIYNVLEHKNKLCFHLESENIIQLDLANVSEIDSAGIQLLMFLKTRSDLEKKEIIFINSSDAVLEVINFLNLSTFLNIPIE